MASGSSSSRRGRSETTISQRTRIYSSHPQPRHTHLPQIPKYPNTLKSSSTLIKTPISNPRRPSNYLPQIPKSSSTAIKIPISKPGESSKSKGPTVRQTFRCAICVEHKPFRKRFPINGCSHSYCSDCVCKYVTSKIDSNVTQIRCPGSTCKGSLEPKHCRSILPHKVFDKWGDALCEATISPSRKFYCPFKDCSALLIKGSDYKNIVESECPFCHRLFCAQCVVPWHSGIKCDEFQKYEREKKGDILFEKLVKEKKWTQCSKCKFYVEKTDGCLSMKCRCGYTFCYNCGARLSDHYCYNCKH